MEMSKYDLILMDISNELLDIVDNKDEFSRGDLQGCIEGQVMRALNFNNNK